MIKLVRVDHRLLHGQVVFKWTKVLGVDCILIASDAVAKDPLRISALRMAKPENCKLVIKSVDDSIKALNSGVTDKYQLLIITETIHDAYELATHVEAIHSINLGGAKMAENHIGALKNEKWQLILVIILNIIGIAAVITGLIMNKTNIVGFVLLGLGFIELVAHFVIPFEKRVLTKGDNYLQLSGYLSLISGIVFLLI